MRTLSNKDLNFVSGGVSSNLTLGDFMKYNQVLNAVAFTIAGAITGFSVDLEGSLDPWLACGIGSGAGLLCSFLSTFNAGAVAFSLAKNEK